jgi:hypothetical protein
LSAASKGRDDIGLSGNWGMTTNVRQTNEAGLYDNTHEGNGQAI